MTEVVQRFLLRNTKFLQNLVNNKLAKRKGASGRFFTWMEIGPRNFGQHVIPKYFRFWNTFMLGFGMRFNWARPHFTKTLMSREREIFMTGYAGLLIMIAFWTRKNRVRPLYQYSDAHLYHYDNPTRFSAKYGMHVPYSFTAFRQSAHYIEINKIFQREMTKRLMEFQQEVETEFKNSTEKERRTKYLSNPNYVYEPFGWELEAES